METLWNLHRVGSVIMDISGDGCYSVGHERYDNDTFNDIY